MIILLEIKPCWKLSNNIVDKKFCFVTHVSSFRNWFSFKESPSNKRDSLYQRVSTKTMWVRILLHEYKGTTEELVYLINPSQYKIERTERQRQYVTWITSRIPCITVTHNQNCPNQNIIYNFPISIIRKPTHLHRSPMILFINDSSNILA